MFKRTVYGLIFTWIGVVAYCLYTFQNVKPQDQEYYKQLMNASDGKGQSANYQTQQKRFNVIKHFIFNKDRERLHMHLRSDSSKIVLNQKENKIEVVECLKSVKCTLQEALVYVLPDGKEERARTEDRSSQAYLTDPSVKKRQIVRQIEAERATYDYKTEELNAEEVNFLRYLASGHELKESPQMISLLMNGKAKGMQLSLANENKPFKAQDLHIGFQEWID